MKSCIRPANGCYDFFKMPHHGLRNQIPPNSFVKTKFMGLDQAAPAFSLCSYCWSFLSLSNCITQGAGWIRRGLSFFRETKRNCPPAFFSFCSCLLISMVPRMKSTRSQVRPRASPSRKPVNRVIVYPAFRFLQQPLQNKKMLYDRNRCKINPTLQFKTFL